MKKKLIPTLIAALCAAFCAVAFAGCDMLDGLFGNGNDPGSEYGNPDYMMFNESKLYLEVGETAELYIAKVYLDDEQFSEYCHEFDLAGLSQDEKMAFKATYMTDYVCYDSDDIRVAEPIKHYEQGVVVQGMSEGTTCIRAYTDDRKYQAVCTVVVTDPNRQPDEDTPSGPKDPADETLTFEFFTATSEDYPYLDSMITAWRGQYITFNTDGTCKMVAGSITATATYTRKGNVFIVSNGNGSSAEYTLEGDLLSITNVLPYGGTNYTITMVYKLKTADAAPVYSELAGKSFAFDSITSDVFDSDTLHTLNNGYKNSTVSFSASGAVEIYNPSDTIGSEPNAYSLQTGTFSCENGEGFVKITAMTAGGEPVRDFLELQYDLSFDGTSLTLFAGEMTFHYTLKNG